MSIDSDLDRVFDRIDAMMRDGKFRLLNELIENINAEDLPIDMLLGILTATLPARSKLPARAKLLDDTRETLTRRGEYKPAVLAGL